MGARSLSGDKGGDEGGWGWLSVLLPAMLVLMLMLPSARRPGDSCSGEKYCACRGLLGVLRLVVEVGVTLACCRGLGMRRLVLGTPPLLSLPTPILLPLLR